MHFRNRRSIVPWALITSAVMIAAAADAAPKPGKKSPDQGKAPVTHNAGPLLMTGVAAAPPIFNAGPLLMTGVAVGSATHNAGPLLMTGTAVAPPTHTVGPLLMTGKFTP